MAGVVKRVAAGVFRRLPPDSRRTLAALLHGETVAQRRLTELVRGVRASAPIPGVGDVVAGPALSPYRAQSVAAFDAHAHLHDLASTVRTALQRAGVPVRSLPGEYPPVLVVADTDWQAAWAALGSDQAAQRLWRGHSSRSEPVDSTAPTAPSCDVFARLVSLDGDQVADSDVSIRLERWDEVRSAGQPRVDGGTHEIGTLVRGDSPVNGFASYLSPRTLELLDDPDHSPAPRIEAVTEPVDLVYTWVDGSDQAWTEKRARWSGEGFTADSQIAARFESRDELRYSLRSVEMYANWFNRLYLVTDAQVPAWLNLEHPRLRVVDHRDLFTAEELPLFNSHAIESRLHHIDGLADRFIYLNDDVFFGQPVTPELFFTGSGQAKFFPSKATIDPGPRNASDVSVTSAAKNNRALLERELGRTITTKLKHTPHAHLTSVLAEMEQRFPEVFEANVAARFRSHDDHSIVSGLAQRYAEATGRAVEGRIRYNYADISRDDIEPLLARWLRLREFQVFCLNDTGIRTLTTQRAEAVDAYLRRYFPVASSFESGNR